MKWYDREVEALENDLANGVITIKEYNKLMRELNHEYMMSAHESAQQAYDREYERW